MKTNKTRKGISLITLVITIIVVIVLAAAVILTLNNNNPVENAKEATFKSDVATIQDDLNLYIADKYAKANGAFDLTTLNLSDTTSPTIANELKSVENSKLKGKVEVQAGKLVFTGEDETEIEWFEDIISQPVVVPGEPVGQNTTYTDSNGKTAIIPQGFKVSTVEAEQTIDTGLVVIAPDESEFVWVPVPDITVHIDKVNNRSRLYEWSKVDGTPTQAQLNGTEIAYSANGYKEPDMLVGRDNDTGGLNQMNAILGISFVPNGTGDASLKEYMQKEWDAIYTSIETNKGFYIGRYETGNIINDDSTTVVSKKNQNDLGGNSNTWYKLYAKQKKYASTLSGTSIKSNMIYGFEYDATMKWFATSTNESVKNYVVNADNEYANFSGIIKATGSVSAVNNIYDLAGNVCDWTAEAYTTYSRTMRGSYYRSSATYRYAGYRDYNGPSGSNTSFGSRLGLYL